MGPIGNDCNFKIFAPEKNLQIFAVALDFIAKEFMENTKKLLWIFGSAEHLYSCRLFQELWFKKKFKA